MAAQRGVSTILSLVLVVAIGISLSVIVSGWLTSTFRDRAQDVKDRSVTKLDCQFADLYVRNVSYNCNSNCASGTSHTLTITLVNSGRKAVSVRDIVFLDRNGTTTTFELNGTQELNATDVITYTNTSTGACTGFRNFVDKVIVSSTTCPKDAVDSYPGRDIVFQSC